MKQLRPVQESNVFYDNIERNIKRIIYTSLYIPLLYYFYKPTNTRTLDLIAAIGEGRITYEKGLFKGSFNAGISKELKSYGAVWDKGEKCFRLGVLPLELREKIDEAKFRFASKIKALQGFLDNIDAKKIAEKVYLTIIIASLIGKVERYFHASVKEIVAPTIPYLSDEQIVEIAKEWQEKTGVWVQELVENQIASLREIVRADTNYQDLMKNIQKNYTGANRRIRNIAHEDIRILVATLKMERFLSVGITQYRWRCVDMPHDAPPPAPHILGNVRYSHGILNGSTQRWDSPPVSTNPGEPARRNNPGFDYGCRCIAIPLARNLPSK